jgi:hypothetical protein
MVVVATCCAKESTVLSVIHVFPFGEKMIVWRGGRIPPEAG